MDITNTLVDEMPNVQENAIDQLQHDHDAGKEKLVDKIGRAFDKAIHLTDGDGEPKLTKGGQIRIKRGHGPDANKKRVSSIGGVETPGTIAFAESKAESEAEILATGQSAASLTFVIGMAMFGSDGKPTQDEINQITYAYQTYFRAKNIRDLPPGIVLVTALATYTVPRMLKPKTSKKITTLWGKLKAKVSKNRLETPDGESDNLKPED